MSVQSRCPFAVPREVRVPILGHTVVAEVVDDQLVADVGRGPRDVLLVEYEGSRYRVDAADATPSR